MAYNNTWGKEAEQIAADYLAGHGYAIRERNWRSGNKSRHEIDIIAQIDMDIVFVEVKARSGEHDYALDAVDDKKMRMMARAADTYLDMLDHDFEYRFDIITVTGNSDSFDIEHFPDAFRSPLFTR